VFGLGSLMHISVESFVVDNVDEIFNRHFSYNVVHERVELGNIVGSVFE